MASNSRQLERTANGYHAEGYAQMVGRVRDIEARGRTTGHNAAYNSTSAPLRSQVPKEKAAAAKGLADELDSHSQLVRDDVAAIRFAAEAGDLADWADAAEDARQGLAQLRCLVERAEAIRNTADIPDRARLANVPQLLADAEALVAGAPAVPPLGSPIVRCAEAVAAVLPPGRALGWQEQRTFSDVVAAQASHADLVALRAIVEGKAQHALTSRFQQFTASARRVLVRILGDRQLAERAQARQATQRQARRARASTATVTPIEAEAPASSAPDVIGDAMLVRGAEPLPYRADMERSFGRSFGDVRVRTDMAAELAPLGAQALTVGNDVMFADAAPSPALVAHEATHVVQNEQAGATAAMASSTVAPRDSAAETEADANARQVAAHGPGTLLAHVVAAPAAHVQLAPTRLVPDPDAPQPRSTIRIPDDDHPSRRGSDGEQVIQTDKTMGPGTAPPLRGKQWKSLAEVTESVHIEDDSGDTLRIDITYRLESRPAELSDVPETWIHTERKALLTIGSGEHAGATIVGQARIDLAPGEPRDPKVALTRASIGPTHWAHVYLAEAGQHIHLSGPGGRTSLIEDAASNDVLAYDDPLRTLVGLKNILKQQRVAGRGRSVAKMHADAVRLLASAKRASRFLEEEIASIKSYHAPRPGRVQPIRWIIGDITNWLAANVVAGRDNTEDAHQLRKAQNELERLIIEAETTRPPERDHVSDALDAPVRFMERTGEGIQELAAMVVDAAVLGVNVAGEATGIGSFDYRPISDYGKSVDASGANTPTALVTVVNGFADAWSDAIERAQHGDYRGATDISIDTLLMIDGARTGGVIAIGKAEALAAKLGTIANNARALASQLPVAAATATASVARLPAEVRAIMAAMGDGADAFVARLRAGGMQMASEGGGGAPGPSLGGLSADVLAEAAEAAKQAFKDKRLAQAAATDPDVATPSTSPPRPPEPTGTSSSTPPFKTEPTPHGSASPEGTPRPAGHSDAQSPPSSNDTYSRDDIDAQLSSVHEHVAAPHFEDRAWRQSVPGQVIKVRAGNREIPVPARKLAHLEPDSLHQTPERQIVRIEVLGTDGTGARQLLGDIQSRPNPPHGVRSDVPVDPPTWLRLHLADGSQVEWLSGGTPPAGFRFQITPNGEFRNVGFSGGHTRDAWTETMRLYGDQIRELPADHLAFSVPGRSTPIDVTIQPYDVRGVPDASGTVRWSRVHYPKSIFEGAGVGSLADFEAHMAPFVANAFNVNPALPIVDIRVPVQSLLGEPLDLRIRVTRQFDVPEGRITSWWVSETAIDPRLRKAALPASPSDVATGGPR